MVYESVGEKGERIRRRVRAANYLVVAQLFLRDNFLLKRKLEFADVKPRLLGHWGSCYGINLAYAVARKYFAAKGKEWAFILGPGHGFPALNANLFIDGEVVDREGEKVTELAEFCREFSWPEGFPSHASPLTPGVVTEGGELGYALGAAYGQVLGHPEKNVVVVVGDGEMETATALASLNLAKIIPSGEKNGRVWPILHLNGYKISGPTILGRKSERELLELVRGFGYTPIETRGEAEEFYTVMREAEKVKNPFIILASEKGETGPEFVEGKKVKGNYLAHQIPLAKAGSDEGQLEMLEKWLESYEFAELYSEKEGFTI